MTANTSAVYGLGILGKVLITVRSEVLALRGLRREFSMRVDDELLGNTAVELRVAVRRLVQ
ncbi:MAG: hypothetical protein QOE04_5610, partial [Mycobacterium sp.]|nr:hypothetical protein [Mycobacterium sp.]